MKYLIVPSVKAGQMLLDKMKGIVKFIDHFYLLLIKKRITRNGRRN